MFLFDIFDYPEIDIDIKGLRGRRNHYLNLLEDTIHQFYVSPAIHPRLCSSILVPLDCINFTDFEKNLLFLYLIRND